MIEFHKQPFVAIFPELAEWVIHNIISGNIPGTDGEPWSCQVDKQHGIHRGFVITDRGDGGEWDCNDSGEGHLDEFADACYKWMRRIHPTAKWEDTERRLEQYGETVLRRFVVPIVSAVLAHEILSAKLVYDYTKLWAPAGPPPVTRQVWNNTFNRLIHNLKWAHGQMLCLVAAGAAGPEHELSIIVRAQQQALSLLQEWLDAGQLDCDQSALEAATNQHCAWYPTVLDDVIVISVARGISVADIDRGNYDVKPVEVTFLKKECRYG